MQVGPNVLNSVPREARLEIDIRDIDGPRRDGTVAAVLRVGPWPRLHIDDGPHCGGCPVHVLGW